MSTPARRGKGAISTVVGTIVSVINAVAGAVVSMLTLPFRLLGQLFGRRRHAGR